MDIFTHMFMGVLAGIFTLTILSPEAIILLWIMSYLPDFDVLLEPLKKIRRTYFLSHKAASHSYIVGLLFTGIIGVIISILRKTSFFEVWLAGFIGYSIHVSLDFFTASKIPLFYPISKKEFRFIADRAINPFLAALSGINILILIIIYYTKPYYHIFMNLAYFYLCFYLVYFGFRVFLRILVYIRAPNNSQYIPGFLPFYYLLHEKLTSNNSLIFKLTKKSIISSEKIELLNKEISNDSDEMVFYELAEEVSKEYRFFHKWDAIIPYIKENDEKINVVLILAESYSRMSSHFLSVVINKNTKKIISKNDGFSSFKKLENISID